MNNRIENRLAELKSQNKKALITYITAGCGGYEQTEEAMRRYLERECLAEKMFRLMD